MSAKLPGSAGKHGGSTAAPIARKMFDAYLLPDKPVLAVPEKKGL